MLNCILTFLSKNVGLIQTISTIFLAIFTAIYVRHTAKLAKIAKEQITILISDRIAKKNEFFSMIRSLINHTSNLQEIRDEDIENDYIKHSGTEKIIRAQLFDKHDLSRVRMLSSDIDVINIKYIEDITFSLSVLNEKISYVKSLNLDAVRPALSVFKPDEWNTHLNGAKDLLNRVHELS